MLDPAPVPSNMGVLLPVVLAQLPVVASETDAVILLAVLKIKLLGMVRVIVPVPICPAAVSVKVGPVTMSPVPAGAVLVSAEIKKTVKWFNPLTVTVSDWVVTPPTLKKFWPSSEALTATFSVFGVGKVRVYSKVPFCMSEVIS